MSPNKMKPLRTIRRTNKKLSASHLKRFWDFLGNFLCIVHPPRSAIQTSRLPPPDHPSNRFRITFQRTCIRQDPPCGYIVAIIISADVKPCACDTPCRRQPRCHSTIECSRKLNHAGEVSALLVESHSIPRASERVNYSDWHTEIMFI